MQRHVKGREFKNEPHSGVIYTYAEINKLDLKDSPDMSFVLVNGQNGSIQDSHCTEQDMLSVPGLAESKWVYLYTTSELIPVFTFAENLENLTKFLDMEPMFDYFKHEFDETDLWVTPKGFRREQYGLRTYLSKGLSLPEGIWMDPDYDSKHCKNCDRAFNKPDAEPTEYNREAFKFEDNCAMCAAKLGNQEAIELQRESIYGNNMFGKKYIPNFIVSTKYYNDIDPSPQLGSINGR